MIINTYLSISINLWSCIHHTKDLIYCNWIVDNWPIKLVLAFIRIGSWHKVMPRLISLTIIAGLVKGKLTRTEVFTKTNHQLVCIVKLVEQNNKMNWFILPSALGIRLKTRWVSVDPEKTPLFGESGLLGSCTATQGNFASNLSHNFIALLQEKLH